MATISLQASVRDPKAKVKAMRRTGLVPGIVYGHNVKDLLIQCQGKDLRKVLIQAGESSIVELDVDGKKIPVLFKDVDFHPVSDLEIHADFYAVNMNKEIETLVPVHFEGEAPAIKKLGGVFYATHDHVKVRCLPAKLPRFIAASIEKLENFHDSLTVKDLTLPEGVEVMEKPETVIAIIQEPRAIEVVTTTAAAAAPGAEGAAAAAPGAEGAAAAAPAAEGAAKEAAAKEAPKK